MIDFSSPIEGIDLATLRDDPSLVLNFLPQESPFLSLQQRIQGANPHILRDFCRQASASILTGLKQPPDLSYFTPEQMLLAQANLTMLQTLLQQDCDHGRVSMQSYTHPFVPSRASQELANQIDAERRVAENFGSVAAIRAINLQIDQILEIIHQTDGIDTTNAQMQLVIGILEDQRQKAVMLAEQAVTDSMRALVGLMDHRKTDILGIIASQFIDPRRYFSYPIPNRDYILSLLSDEILRRVNAGYNLETFISVGVGIGDINSLSVANLDSHTGGDHYIGLIGDLLTQGIVTLLLKAYGKGPTELHSDREIGSMMRGSDEAGAEERYRVASVRDFVKRLNLLRLEEVWLYDTTDIIDLRSPTLLDQIGKILRLPKPYVPKPGEKFGAGVTFAGESFLYALAHVHPVENPRTFYAALRPIFSFMLDTADRNANGLKDEVKRRVAKDSPANMALQTASRAFHLLVEMMAKNQANERLFNFMSEATIADLGPLERVLEVISISEHDAQLLEAIRTARENHSDLLRFITGEIRHSNKVKSENGKNA